MGRGCPHPRGFRGWHQNSAARRGAWPQRTAALQSVLTIVRALRSQFSILKSHDYVVFSRTVDRKAWTRDVAVLVAVAAACRLAVLHILPEGAHSTDLRNWERVADLLHEGANPYAATTHLNWPPFWMQILWLVRVMADATQTAFADVLRWLLIGVDIINLVLTYRIAVAWLGVARPRTILLIGLAANPIMVLLVCQHANFDVLVVTALLGFTAALLRWSDSRDPVDWLAAALFAGIGILIKTIPFVLTPLLCHRGRSLSARAIVLGAALVLFPVTLGISVIYVLSPDAVTEHVLRYRSYSGWFGVSGLLNVAGYYRLTALHASLFPLALLAGLLFLGRHLARRPSLEPRHIVLLIATVLLTLITAGTGYGPQYLAWTIPFFVLTFERFDTAWRSALLTTYVVVAITYVIEYAFIESHGAFLMPSGRPAVLQIAEILTQQDAQTLLRLPMFAAFVWVVVAGVRRLRYVPAG